MATEWHLTGWPIVEFHLRGPQSLADVRGFLDGLDALLARGRPFGVITAKVDVRYTEPGPSARAQIDWMAARADALGERLRGMANVVAPELCAAERRALPARSRHVPFPAAVFDDVADARRWLAGLPGLAG